MTGGHFMKKNFKIISVVLALMVLLPTMCASAKSIDEWLDDGVCPICGEKFNRFFCYIESDPAKEATCADPAQYYVHCYNGGEVDMLMPIGDPSEDHTGVTLVKTVEATCTESGCEYYHCTDCGEDFDVELPPFNPEGHSYEASHASCTDTYIEYRCTICENVKREAKTPTQHSFKAEPFDCSDESVEYYCTVCGEWKQEGRTPSAHKWTDWDMVKAPTASSDGQKTRSCTVCGRSETKTVPAGSASKYIEGVSLGDFELNYKSSAVIEAEVLGGAGAQYKVKYSSSAPEIASVDNSGNVTANKKGSAVITVTVTDSDGFRFEDKGTVTVKYAWWQWIINILLLGFLWY